MTIKEVAWDDDTILHIARHGVDPQEVEKVCFGNKALIFKGRGKTYYALGQTDAGRYLAVIFRYLGQNRTKIITARAMSESEKKYYLRRK